MRECWKNIDRNWCLVIDRPRGEGGGGGRGVEW